MNVKTKNILILSVIVVWFVLALALFQNFNNSKVQIANEDTSSSEKSSDSDWKDTLRKSSTTMDFDWSFESGVVSTYTESVSVPKILHSEISTTNWKKHESLKSGLSFKYPPDSIVTQTEDAVLVSRYERGTKNATWITIERHDNPEKLSPEQYFDGQRAPKVFHVPEAVESVLVNDSLAYRIDGIGLVPYVTYIIVLEDGTILDITDLGASYDRTDELLAIVESVQVTEQEPVTVKDISDWPRYQISDTGVSFAYPPQAEIINELTYVIVRLPSESIEPPFLVIEYIENPESLAPEEYFDGVSAPDYFEISFSSETLEILGFPAYRFNSAGYVADAIYIIDIEDSFVTIGDAGLSFTESGYLETFVNSIVIE